MSSTSRPAAYIAEWTGEPSVPGKITIRCGSCDATDTFLTYDEWMIGETYNDGKSCPCGNKDFNVVNVEEDLHDGPY